MKKSKLIQKSLNLVNLYYQRAHSRRELANLDRRMLKDAGITRSEQQMEINKPFWKK